MVFEIVWKFINILIHIGQETKDWPIVFRKVLVNYSERFQTMNPDFLDKYNGDDLYLLWLGCSYAQCFCCAHNRQFPLYKKNKVHKRKFLNKMSSRTAKAILFSANFLCLRATAPSNDIIVITYKYSLSNCRFYKDEQLHHVDCRHYFMVTTQFLPINPFIQH